MMETPEATPRHLQISTEINETFPLNPLLQVTTDLGKAPQGALIGTQDLRMEDTRLGSTERDSLVMLLLLRNQGVVLQDLILGVEGELLQEAGQGSVTKNAIYCNAL